MSSRPIERIGHEWCARAVPTFNGARDTHIDTGEDYDPLTLYEIFTMQPGASPKMDGLAMIPSMYRDYDARVHKVQQERGEFVALTADIDTGNHGLETIRSLVKGFCREAAWLIYSSPHARPGDMRWRVIVPLLVPAPFDEWIDAQHAFFAMFERADIEVDRALDRAGQPVYLPNVPEYHEKSGDRLRGEDGEALYYESASTGCATHALTLARGPIAAGIAEIKRQREADEREREKIRREAEERRANRQHTDGAPIIEDFNRENSIATMLELYGYEQSPRHGEDWRSPNQTSESYATRIMGDKWVSLSGSDAGVGLGEKCKAGCFGDAYDLFVHYEHGGDHKAAFRALYAERRAATQHLPPPPPPSADDPGWTEPPEGPEEDDEAVVDVPDFIEGDEEPDTFEFLTLDELETLPPPSYLVDGFIVDDGLSIFYGDPGGGKSFLSVDLGLRVASGMEWHGQETHQTGVLYVAGEGVRGLGKRARGWRLKHGVATKDGIPFALLPTAAQILDSNDRAKLIRTIDKVRDALDFPIGMVVIDTVSRSIAGADENTQETMSAFVKACDDIRGHIGGAVIGVHHSGKDKDRGMRGSTVLLGGADAVFKVEKSELAVTLTCEKQKDDEQAAPVYFDMEKYGWPAATEDDPENWDTTLIPIRMSKAPDATDSISRDMIRQAFAMLIDAWTDKKPLSNKPQTRASGRYAPAIFARQIGGTADGWKELIFAWLENGNLAEEIADAKRKIQGLQVLDAVV